MSRRRDTPYDTPYYLDWSCVMDQNPGFNFTHVRGVPHISFMFSGYFTHILREWNLHEFPGGCCGPRVDFNFTHVGKNDPTHTHTANSPPWHFFSLGLWDAILPRCNCRVCGNLGAGQQPHHLGFWRGRVQNSKSQETFWNAHGSSMGRLQYIYLYMNSRCENSFIHRKCTYR